MVAVEPEDELQPRQSALYEALEVVAEHFGKFDATAGPNGAHYMSEDDNPFVDEGLMCGNCVFYEGGQACEIVSGQIHPMALCKLWIIKGDLIESPVDKADLTPPEGVRAAARRALGWIADGKQGDGFTATGRYRAQTLANGDSVSMDTIRRMASFFARHEVDKKATGFSQGEDGYPSAGRVAWDAWGGDAGWSWAKSVIGSVEKKQFGSRSAAGQYAANIRWSRAGRAMGEVASAEVDAFVGDALVGSDTANLFDSRVAGIDWKAPADGLRRDQMPQVPSNEKEQFLREAEANGVKWTHTTATPSSLKPSQKEASAKATAEIVRREEADANPYRLAVKDSVLVSSDGFVLDGHHRWGAARLSEARGDAVQLSVIRLNANREQAFGMMKAWQAKTGGKPQSLTEHRSRYTKQFALNTAFIKACRAAIKETEDYANTH